MTETTESAAMTPGQAAFETHELASSHQWGSGAYPWDEGNPTSQLIWELSVQAGIDAAHGTYVQPEFRLDRCPRHSGQKELQVRRGDDWLCLRAAIAAQQPQPARSALEAIARAAQGSMDGSLPLDRGWVVTEALRGLGGLPGGDEGGQPQPAPELAAAIQDIIDRHPEREKQPAPDHAPSDEQLAAAHATIDRMQQQLLDAGDEIGRLRRGCGVHPGIPGYEHPECGFHWHGKDGAERPA